MALVDRLDGLVHEETQTHDRGVDLTAGEIARVGDPGRVDFGGGELADATLDPVATERRDPDDEYGWWTLEGGTYLVSHNERLSGDDPVCLQTRRELRQRGASHPSLRTTELGPVPLTVADGGIRIKENARVSTLRDG